MQDKNALYPKAMTDVEVVVEYHTAVGASNALLIMAQADMQVTPHLPWTVRFFSGNFINKRTELLLEMAQEMSNETVKPLRKEIELRGLTEMLIEAKTASVH